MKKRLLSVWVAICAVILLIPPSLATDLGGSPADAAAIGISNLNFTETDCAFEAKLSGADMEGWLFVAVYAQSGQMTRAQRFAAADTVAVDLHGLLATDSVKAIWLDGRSMPLADTEVFRSGIVSDDAFAGALLTMIQTYEDKDAKEDVKEKLQAENIAQSDKSELDYAFARLIVGTREELPDLNGFHVAQRLSDPNGYTILQFTEAQYAKDCESYLKERITNGFVEPDRLAYVAPKDGDARENAEDIDDAAARSWGVPIIKADEYAKDLYDRGINRSITVAVVDTGVDYNHSFLKGRTVSGFDYVGNDADPMDEQYHGTHVAGTVVDCTPNLTNLKIMPVRVLDASGSGYSSAVGLGIRYAADHGANVINLSLGGGHSDYKDDAIKYALSKNVVVVVAAGNSAMDADNHCPAHIKDAITVAAVGKAGENLEPASFSNYGAVVDLAAPGVDIDSCVPTRKSSTGYAKLSGTSMAAPHVAACAALLLEDNPGLQPSQVEERLVSMVQVPSKWNQGTKKYGAGVVNMKPSNSSVFYAILYADGELVFQKSPTPASGRATMGNKEPYTIASDLEVVQFTKWYEYRHDITKVTFADKIQPKTTATWFFGCDKLTTVRNLSNLDLSKVTDMSQMFSGCSALTTLDLSALDTSSVTNMREMFLDCSKLLTLNLSGWNTANVTRMEDMFKGCSVLRTIYASDTFNVSKVTDGNTMFQNCGSSLKGGAGTTWASSRISKTYARIDGGSSAPGYFTSANFYAILYTDGELVFQNSATPASGRATKHAPYPVSTLSASVSQYTLWYDYRADIKSVTFANVIQPLTTATWFYGCDSLTTVRNPGNLNLSKVTDMSQMFSGCSALTALDLSAWNTSGVTNMREMFLDCSKLRTLNLSGWNTANVTRMEDMFKGCSKLETITASDTFSVSKVTDGNTMFQNCSSSLKGGAGTVWSPSHIDKSYAKRDGVSGTPGYFSPGVTPPVTPTETLYAVLYSDGELAFQSSLSAQAGKTIVKTYEADSEGYDKKERGVYMAWYDEAGTAIKSVNFATPIYPTSTAQWFYYCQSLSDIKNPGNLHTDFVTNMSQMFAHCSSLKTVDLSGFNTAKTTNTEQMFYRCSKLTTIYASSSFVTSAITESRNMFAECSALKGGKGTAYASDRTDKTYARIDNAPSAFGYFTNK